jgi:predicted secreted Zn-dependent protease
VNRLNFLGLLAGVAVLSCAAPAPAQDTVIVTTNYYTGSGATARELGASLAQSRPWKDSDRRDGQTQWHIEWNFQLIDNGNGCRLRSLTTKTTITITLPKWNMPSSLAERWKNYCDALKQHEARHAQIALEAAAAIRKRVTTLQDTSSCQKLTEFINAAANKVIAEFREQEVQFDKRTDHGRKEGASFP